MNKRDTVFIKRIGRSDIDSWLDIPELLPDGQITTDRQSFKHLLDMTDDILLYMTVLDQEPIGGTALFRDRNRLGLALISVRMEQEHVQNLLVSTIKASLPFFRTAAIRDVDAVISNESERLLPFPKNTYLNRGLYDVLREVGFEDIGTLFSARFEGSIGPDCRQQKIERSGFTEDVRSFVWKQIDKTMTDCSHTWLSILQLASTGSLFVYRSAGVAAVLGFMEYGKRLVIPVIGYDSNVVDPSTLASAIGYEAAKRGAQWIDIRLLAQHDNPVIAVLEKMLSADALITKHSLMRRRL